MDVHWINADLCPVHRTLSVSGGLSRSWLARPLAAWSLEWSVWGGKNVYLLIWMMSSHHRGQYTESDWTINKKNKTKLSHKQLEAAQPRHMPLNEETIDGNNILQFRHASDSVSVFNIYCSTCALSFCIFWKSESPMKPCCLSVGHLEYTPHCKSSQHTLLCHVWDLSRFKKWVMFINDLAKGIRNIFSKKGVIFVLDYFCNSRGTQKNLLS